MIHMDKMQKQTVCLLCRNKKVAVDKRLHNHNWINHPEARYNPTWTAPASDGAQEGGPEKRQERATDLPREDHRLVVWACHSLNSDSAWPREIGHRAFQQDEDDAME